MAKDLIVSAKNGKTADAPSASITLKVPENLDEARQMYGDEAILSNALSNWIVTVQAGIRRDIAAGKTQEQIQAHLGGSKMGVSAERTSDPKAAYLAKFQAMTPEEKAAEIKRLQELAKAK
jgi:hypothetical protein